MSRSSLLRTGVRVLLISLLLTSVFAFGSVAGIYIHQNGQVNVGIHDDHDEHDEHDEHDDHDEHDEDAHEEEEDHVALSKQAVANLNLRMGTVSRGDYWKTLLVPARSIEIPGRSDLSISAPVSGVIDEAHPLPGQSVLSGEPLFVIRLTDGQLIDAQSKLLESLTRQEVVDQEIERLRPLRNTGAVAGARTRELEYERRQLIAQQSTLLQELQSRGLPQSMIDGVVADRKLASTLTVYPPSFVGDDGKQGDGEPTGFSVETLIAHPGKSVTRGAPLCTIAYHSKLYLEGTAFGDDLPVLNRIVENGWNVTVETHETSSLGASPHGASHQHESPLSLDLLRIDNHVDEQSQTVKFYVELPNSVTRTRRSDGRLFEQWRFRPGQRLHLRLPVEQWKHQLTLPVDAVVVDGPNVFVFAEHDHHEPSAVSISNTSLSAAVDGELDVHEDFTELELIPVRLLFRDDKTVVIADDGQLHLDEHIALNNAQKLYLAFKMQSGGGGGHHHHHDH